VTALLLLVSYLLGAFPTSLLMGKVARGIDLREYGSGNLGATNAFRVLGWRLAVPVLAIDVFKGWLPAFLFPILLGLEGAWPLAFGAAAIIGHVFSVLVRFRGGKGVATSAGVFLALAPAATLLAIALWTGLVVATRIVSIGSIAAAATLPVFVYMTQGLSAAFWLSLAVGILVVLAHRKNLRRLVRCEAAQVGGERREGR
jgi:acyl phosphate:glycerol-3-phosphate acyltransferase